MRHWAYVLILAAPPTPRAAEDPAFQVPKTWEKVTAGPGAAVFFTARDGYAVWVDQVIVKGTEHNRAGLYTNTVHRLKIGSEKPEVLVERRTTHGLVALLGPKGAVATGYFSNCDTVHLPGHKPLPLPKDVRFTAQHFTADGLVCTGEVSRDGKYLNEIVLLPIDRERGALGEAQVLREWFPAIGPDEFKFDFHHGRVLLRGDFVAGTGELPDPERKRGFNKPALAVWDGRNKKETWREEYVTLEAADSGYAYWFPDPDAVARRPLDGKTKAEMLRLPKGTVRLTIQPPYVFALMPREKGKEWVLARFGLATGARADLDLKVPDDRQLISASDSGRHRTFAIRTGGGVLPLDFDAPGQARVVWKHALYTIPVAEEYTAADKPKWEPLPVPK